MVCCHRSSCYDALCSDGFSKRLLVSHSQWPVAAPAAAFIVNSLQLRAAWGAAPLWPGEEKDLRVVKLPAGASSLLVEAGPNPKNENSAVWVTYQVRLAGFG